MTTHNGDDFDPDGQARSLEFCTCGHTRGSHFRSVLRGEYVAPCALCDCADFKPEDYEPRNERLDNSQIGE